MLPLFGMGQYSHCLFLYVSYQDVRPQKFQNTHKTVATKTAFHSIVTIANISP